MRGSAAAASPPLAPDGAGTTGARRQRAVQGANQHQATSARRGGGTPRTASPSGDASMNATTRRSSSLRSASSTSASTAAGRSEQATKAPGSQKGVPCTHAVRRRGAPRRCRSASGTRSPAASSSSARSKSRSGRGAGATTREAHEMRERLRVAVKDGRVATRTRAPPQAAHTSDRRRLRRYARRSGVGAAARHAAVRCPAPGALVFRRAGAAHYASGRRGYFCAHEGRRARSSRPRAERRDSGRRRPGDSRRPHSSESGTLRTCVSGGAHGRTPTSISRVGCRCVHSRRSLVRRSTHRRLSSASRAGIKECRPHALKKGADGGGPSYAPHAAPGAPASRASPTKRMPSGPTS